jgi:flagellar basal body-associated protein FliL
MALIIVLSILSAGLLGLIVFFFFSKKSSRSLKRAALGALIAIGISLGVCGFFIIQGPAVPEAEFYLPLAAAADEPPVKGANFLSLLVFLVILVALLALIIYIGMRDQRKKAVEEAIADFDESGEDI